MEDHPWVIDIGAWPEGFAAWGNLRARIHVNKIVFDLRLFERWLRSLAVTG
jgi:hypothetical protein